MIIENKINEIIDYKIRVNKNLLPRSTNHLLPPFFYSALFVGSTGTGKTFKLVELLKLYEKYDIIDPKGNKMGMRIVFFVQLQNQALMLFIMRYVFQMEISYYNIQTIN